MASQADHNDNAAASATHGPIKWIGNLNDDCQAQWAGLVLHAEQMDRKHWWWGVTDESTREFVANSNDGTEVFRNGKTARRAAEAAARAWRAQAESSNTSLERTRER